MVMFIKLSRARRMFGVMVRPHRNYSCPFVNFCVARSGMWFYLEW